VLVPEGLADGERVTPIVSVGPYFGHIGAVYDEQPEQAGPSTRFSALVTEGKLLERGYALVMVDGRGFGGSTGCHDAGGPGERADVQAAIDWAAAQPWSTGSVGMYGKSWDAMTGLIGVNLDDDKLGAVVAQEPIWDLERNFWSAGVSRSSISGIASTYSTAMLLPGMPDDEAHYQENATPTEADLRCTTLYQQSLRTTDPAFWGERDFAERAKGNDTPLFFTQGFTEWNTEAEGMRQFLGQAHTVADDTSRHGSAANTYLTSSEPVKNATRLTGTPELNFKAAGYGNVMVRLYDVTPDGTATWFNEQVSTVRSGKVTVSLRSHGWSLAKGHQLAVEIGTVQPAGDVSQPGNNTPIEGERAVYLDSYITLSTTKITPGEGSFTLSTRKG
jgi:predicted acyl esterase